MAETGYQLKSELARVCLPAPRRAVPRRLAWANSISLLFLVIGILGAQSTMPGSIPVPPLEQPVAVLVEPTPAPPAAAAAETENQDDSEKPRAPAIQPVVIDTPAINFAVPTVGDLVVPLSLAQAPAAGGGGGRGGNGAKKTAPATNDTPAVVQSTGSGGLRPAPEYPPIARQLGQQGTVILLLTVNDSGAVMSAEIYKSSGSIILDTAARKWVERRWMQPPLNGNHKIYAPIQFVLRQQ
ncbi:MAG TPA: energy transducer TonB [Verrucomicrobiae bacterium]|jgi:protein TonB